MADNLSISRGILYKGELGDHVHINNVKVVSYYDPEKIIGVVDFDISTGDLIKNNKELAFVRAYYGYYVFIKTVEKNGINKNNLNKVEFKVLMVKSVMLACYY
ncbi:MAG: hypothetical protein HQK76_10390 [Desulfobacterales bacterium]|nr:hypothetical protein [Desulfobacterales bacterium]